MLPISPNLNLANTDQTSQSGAGKASATSGAQGGSRGSVVNIAFPGATLAADTGGDAGGVPWWVWAVGAAGAVAVAVIWWKGRR